jgi:hypothetical protein
MDNGDKGDNGDNTFWLPMEKYWELGIDEWVSYMYIYHDENKLFSMKWSCGFV